MNKNIKRFYVAVKEDKVIFFESNLSEFINGIRLIIPNVKSLSFYDKAFKREDTIFHIDTFGKKVVFQKLI